MSHVRNLWGGEFEASPPSREGQRDYDQKAEEYRSALSKDQVMEESWLLRPRKEKKKKSMDSTVVLRTVLWVSCLVGIVVLVVLAVPRWRHEEPVVVPDNYTVALHHALMFFNAQKSGRLPQQNNVSWRGDSGLKDEILGGYYDAGDTVKYSFPASFAMTMLSWSVIEYSANYDQAGELDHVKDIVRWGTDYLLQTFNSSGNSVGSVVAQLGGDRDLDCWMRPEDMDDDDEGNPRRATHCSKCPALAAEMAAALAAASIVFRDDYGYSKKLVHGANVLFKFATNGQGENYAGGPDPPSRYYNSSGYWDELVWGGTWLYLATGNLSYLQLITSPKMANKSFGVRVGPKEGVFSWDNKQAGALLLLARVRIFLGYGYPYEDMLSKYHRNIEDIMCNYLPFSSSFTRTKGGLIRLNHGKPRPLQYVVNAAFLASLFGDYLNAELIPGWQCRSQFYSTEVLRDFATSQIDYILGKNPQNLSYIVGFGDNFPQQVHHRGASIPYNKVEYGCTGGWKWRDSKQPNPNIIVGAMVAGPNKNDGFFDLRFNANYTEPTTAGNAGLVAALVALSGGETSKIDKNTIFHGITPLHP